MDIKEAVKLVDPENMGSWGQCLVGRCSGIKIIYNPRKLNLSPEKEQEIKNSWKKQLKDHPADFNGPMVSMRIYYVKDGILQIRARKTDYATHCHTADLRPSSLKVHWGSLDNKYPLVLSVSAITQTKETQFNPNGCIVFGIRGNTTFEENLAVLIPSGYVDPSKDVINSKEIEIEKSIKRELREELRVNNFSEMKILGMVYNRRGSRQPLIVTSIKIPHTAEEIIGYSRKNKELEITETICVPNNLNSLLSFARNNVLCDHDIWKLSFYIAEKF